MATRGKRRCGGLACVSVPWAERLSFGKGDSALAKATRTLCHLHHEQRTRWGGSGASSGTFRRGGLSFACGSAHAPPKWRFAKHLQVEPVVGEQSNLKSMEAKLEGQLRGQFTQARG